QSGSLPASNYFKSRANLLAEQPIELVGVLLELGPDQVQRSRQVRAERQIHGQRSVMSISFPQGIPRQAQLAVGLHVRPRLLGHRGGVARLAVRGPDAEHSLAAAQLPDPEAVAAVVPVAGVPQAT